VLADPDLRSGIKDFSSWPTVPQARPPPALEQSGTQSCVTTRRPLTLPA